jgi:hypothetical protein
MRLTKTCVWQKDTWCRANQQAKHIYSEFLEAEAFKDTYPPRPLSERAEWHLALERMEQLSGTGEINWPEYLTTAMAALQINIKKLLQNFNTGPQINDVKYVSIFLRNCPALRHSIYFY